MNDEERQDESSPSGMAGGLGRYPMWVGLAFLVLIVYVTINSARTDEGGLLGVGEAERGSPLKEFALPDVSGELVGDANIFQDDCERSENPCPAGDRRTPACQVKGAHALRVCDFFDRPFAISFWFTRGGDCLPAQDAFDRVARRYRGRANFLSVNVRGDIDDVRSIVAERGWSVPVGWDRDGAVSNIYRVGVCPTVAFAYPGGILHDAVIGTEELNEQALRTRLDELIAASRARAEVR